MMENINLYITIVFVKKNENTNSKVISRTDRYGINLKTVFCLNCGSLRFNPYLNEESLKIFIKTIINIFIKDIKTLKNILKIRNIMHSN